MLRCSRLSLSARCRRLRLLRISIRGTRGTFRRSIAALQPHANYTAGGVPAAFNIPVDSLTSNYPYTGTPSEAYQGSITTKVFANASGQLAFVYQLNNLLPPGSPPSTRIDRFTINDPTNPWAGVTINGAGANGGGSSTPVTTGPFGSWNNGNPFSYRRDGIDSGISTNFTFGSSGTQLTSTTNDISAVLWFTYGDQVPPDRRGADGQWHGGDRFGFCPDGS